MIPLAAVFDAHAFKGFLSGPSFQEHASANLGLLDQRFALDWIQKYIHLFGGDPNRVTLIGQSAGGGSVLLQLTAYGGSHPGKTPFRRTIPQSPFFAPFSANFRQEELYRQTLATANVSSFTELRNLPTAQLQTANALMVGRSTYGLFTYGIKYVSRVTPELTCICA